MTLPRIKPFAYKTADQYYFRLSLIFYLLAAIPMVPFIVVYLQMQEGALAPPFGADLNATITAILAVFAFGNVVLGMRLYKQEIQPLSKEHSLRERLDLFFHASMIQYSCMEAAAIMAVAGLYLTRMTFFVLLYLGMLIIFAQVRPEMRRISKQLKMTKEEEDIVYQKKEID
ncbi:hypothetical protein RT717_19585 [Imperialibacter roseus]|uniref:Integral membrane protein n=1 Tax=Imperialibacter roseus TaxID=1324217 RepID=A0ABZ0INK3_9BACT|nr:hypothetical protein [Imperialibacter roseus]WOK05286.1 hypothetical protein RT717_19585 [Imperialibacter roseus]